MVSFQVIGQYDDFECMLRTSVLRNAVSLQTSPSLCCKHNQDPLENTSYTSMFVIEHTSEGDSVCDVNAKGNPWPQIDNSFWYKCRRTVLLDICWVEKDLTA